MIIQFANRLRECSLNVQWVEDVKVSSYTKSFWLQNVCFIAYLFSRPLTSSNKFDLMTVYSSVQLSIPSASMLSLLDGGGR